MLTSMESKKMELEGSSNAMVLDVGDGQTVVCLPQQQTITEREAWEAWKVLEAAKRYQEELLKTPKFPIPA
jgi:hypothetical protein